MPILLGLSGFYHGRANSALQLLEKPALLFAGSMAAIFQSCPLAPPPR